MYVALEGIDTCGKSTQIALLRERFPEALFVKEPGFTQLGKGLREILLNGHIESKIAELFLFLADRAELIETTIKPNIEKLIISDRSLISGMAYAKEFDLKMLKELNLFAVGGILPQKVIFLKLTKDELIRRISQKEQDRIERGGTENLLTIQERIEAALNELDVEFLRISADKPLEAINSEIISFIKGG